MKRSHEYFNGYRAAWKDAVTALLAKADSMNDPKAKDILHAVAWELGEHKHKQIREPMKEETYQVTNPLPRGAYPPS